MILYNSILAKTILNKKKENVMLFGLHFTKRKFPEPCKDMEMMIYRKQYIECTLLSLIPTLILSLLVSWWFMLLTIIMYRALYYFEWILLLCFHKTIRKDHEGSFLSAFDIEAKENSYDLLYLRKRKRRAWMKHYGKADVCLETE